MMQNGGGIEIYNPASAPISNHNDLLGLQGGTTNEYYHLTSAQHTEITTFFAATNITGAEAEELTSGGLTSLHTHISPAPQDVWYTISCPAGTNPTPDTTTDTLTLTSTTSSITITGTASTDRVDFILNLANANTWTATQSFAAIVTTIAAAGNAVNLTVTQNDTTNNPRAVSITNTGTAASLFIDANGATSSSTSVGGAILLENTGNTGAGFIIYSNAGASSGRLMNIRADNVLFDQAAFHVDYDGTANAVEFVNNSTDSSSNAVNIVSNNPNDTALGVNGVETGKGTIKVVHNVAGGDSNASGISIDLQGTGTAAQGLYVDSTASGGTTGNLLRLRNQSIDRFTVNFDGSWTVMNPAGTFEYTFVPAAILANRTINLPLTTSTATLAVLELAQTFTEATIFGSTVEFQDNVTFGWDSLFIKNPANTFAYQFQAAAITGSRLLNLPLITGTDTLAALGLAQTFTAAQTVSANLITQLVRPSANATYNLGSNAFKYVYLYAGGGMQILANNYAFQVSDTSGSGLYFSASVPRNIALHIGGVEKHIFYCGSSADEGVVWHQTRTGDPTNATLNGSIYIFDNGASDFRMRLRSNSIWTEIEQRENIAITPGATITLTHNAFTNVRAIWTTHAGNETVNASGTQVAGQRMVCIITNDAGGARTITFGTGFKPSATIVGTASLTATIQFVSDGTNWWEVSRTLGL